MHSPSEQIGIRKEGKWFVITHHPSGVTTQGESRVHALMMLADALAAVNNSHTVEELQEMAEEVYTPDYDSLEELFDEED